MTNELQGLLDDFLERWQTEDLEHMTLSEYVGVNNKDTFCQWVETKTRMLGSIKGMTSIKFGIYERKNPNKKPKNYGNGKKYSWLKGYGDNKNKVFESVKKDLLKIIDFSKKGNFQGIDTIPLPNLYKWKVAFLFSNERLIPIFQQETLLKIAEHFGLKTNRNTKISEIQDIMITNKPANLNVYQYMHKLYSRFGSDNEKDEILGKKKKQSKRRRKGTEKRNTKSQKRNGSRSYVANQIHNLIQVKLIEKLCLEYGKENVLIEENNVDVKLLQPTYLSFYEIKSSSYATKCIEEALGQVLLYTHYDDDKRKKKIYVVGQYPATRFDIEYIDFVNSHLSLEFEYLNINID